MKMVKVPERIFVLEFTEVELNILFSALGCTNFSCRNDQAKIEKIDCEPVGLADKLYTELRRLLKGRKR